MSDGNRFTLDEFRQAVEDAGLKGGLCAGCIKPMQVTVTDRHDGLGHSTRIRVDQKCVTAGCEFNASEPA